MTMIECVCWQKPGVNIDDVQSSAFTGDNFAKKMGKIMLILLQINGINWSINELL